MTVALRADVDMRTVAKYLLTEVPIRPRPLSRIEAALRDLGHINLLRAHRSQRAA